MDNENKEKVEELAKAVEEAKADLNIEKKGFWSRLWAFCKKWAKRLALPIGVVIGYVIKMLLDKNSDDEVTEPVEETTAE